MQQPEQVMNGAARQSVISLSLTLSSFVREGKEANRRLDQRCNAQLCLSCCRCDARRRFEVPASWSPSSLKSNCTVSFAGADVYYNSVISRSRSVYKKISRKVSENFVIVTRCCLFLFFSLPMCPTFTVLGKFFKPQKLFFLFK